MGRNGPFSDTCISPWQWEAVAESEEHFPSSLTAGVSAWSPSRPQGRQSNHLPGTLSHLPASQPPEVDGWGEGSALQLLFAEPELQLLALLTSRRGHQDEDQGKSC